MSQSEHVLVAPTAVFHGLGYFQGFSAEVARHLPALLDSRHLSYRPRAEVEGDPGYKQLIPYVILHHRDSAGRSLVFHYARGAGQGEGRLHRKRSVGIGGHISACDGPPGPSPYEEGLRRELAEEVRIDSPYVSECVGLINDDLTEVGRVHLGIVHRFDLQRPEVVPQEDDILRCGFEPVETLLAELDGFESWSQICLRALFS